MVQAVKDTPALTAAPRPRPSAALRTPPRTEREQARLEAARRLRAARAAFARMHRSP